MARKRPGYFATGTLVVWDIYLLSSDVVRVYRAADPGNRAVYRHGQTVDVEPALPGGRCL